MAASGSATPRLEFTGRNPGPRENLLPFSFETQPGTADRLIVKVRWPRNQGYLDQFTTFGDVVQVAFYPIEMDGQLVYIMTLWEWDLEDDCRRQIHFGCLFSNMDAELADDYPGFLWPVDMHFENENTRAGLAHTRARRADVCRFSPTEVDRSVDENLWARLNWNALRVDGYVVASSNNPNAMRSAAAVQDAADDAADDADDPLLKRKS